MVGGRILIADLEPPGSRAALAVKRRQRCIGTEAVLIRRCAVRMIGAVAVAAPLLRGVIVEADIELIAIDRTGIAVDELDARSRGRLQDDTQVAAPAVRREQAETIGRAQVRT